MEPTELKHFIKEIIEDADFERKRRIKPQNPFYPNLIEAMEKTDPSLSVDVFSDAIAKALVLEYGKHNITRFFLDLNKKIEYWSKWEENRNNEMLEEVSKRISNLVNDKNKIK